MTATDPNAEQAPESVDANDFQGPRRERPDWEGDPAPEPAAEPTDEPAPTEPAPTTTTPPSEPPKPKA